MNIKMLLFTGIITAFAGALLGLIVAHIAERESRPKVAIVVGSSLGFTIGIGYEAMQYNRKREEID